MRGTWVVTALAVMAVAGCDDGPTQVADAPAVYNLVALESPAVPTTEFREPTVCGRMLRSAIESGTFTINADHTWRMNLIAWRQQLDDEPIPCPKLFSFDISTTLTGTWTEPGSGALLELRLPAGDLLGTMGGIGESRPSILVLSNTGLAALGPLPPYNAMTTSTWHRAD